MACAHHLSMATRPLALPRGRCAASCARCVGSLEGQGRGGQRHCRQRRAWEGCRALLAAADGHSERGSHAARRQCCWQLTGRLAPPHPPCCWCRDAKSLSAMDCRRSCSGLAHVRSGWPSMCKWWRGAEARAAAMSAAVALDRLAPLRQRDAGGGSPIAWRGGWRGRGRGIRKRSARDGGRLACHLSDAVRGSRDAPTPPSPS